MVDKEPENEQKALHLLDAYLFSTLHNVKTLGNVATLSKCKFRFLKINADLGIFGTATLESVCKEKTNKLTTFLILTNYQLYLLKRKGVVLKKIIRRKNDWMVLGFVNKAVIKSICEKM